MDKCKGCIHTDVCNQEVGYGYAECPHYKSADVAPRAEVARLQSQVNRLKKYDEERDIALHAELIAHTRQEVAKEIFEEVERVISETKIGSLYGYYFTKDIRAYIVELKKKYTEEQK